jgi:uncharacterized protein (TIGR03437 family)
MRSIKTTLLFLLALAAFPWQSSAQSYDSSGDGMLSGTYYIRQVIYVVNNCVNPQGTATGYTINTYGNITFDGKGGYTFNGSYFDPNVAASPTAFTGSGTYVISASGMGYITAFNPELTATDLIIGLVSPKGIFIGSSTQNTQASETGYNDLVIAAPVGSTPATNATLKGSYAVAYFDPTYFPTTATSGTLPGGDALLTFTADGQGNIGNVNVNGYSSDNTTASTESLTGVTYAFSNGGATINLGGNSNALVNGGKLLYISPDGNFIFGGDYEGFDMFVGVRAATSNPTKYEALYYQAGLDLDQSGAADGYVLLDSYYGAISLFSGNIIGHQSLNAQLLYAGAADYTYYDEYTLGGNGSSTDADFGQQYWSTSDGSIRIGYGNSPAQGYPLGINVAFQAPSLTGAGPYLFPNGVVNAASSAPFTARVSPGEFLTLYGTDLAPSEPPSMSAKSLPLPTILNQVQVKINDVYAPINFVSPTQISVVVPFDTTQSVAQIQVLNNGVPSNTVTQFVGTSSAGVFTYDPSGGIGYSGALDVTRNYSTVGPSNPAQIGDTIAVYLTGLGTVTGSTAAGAAGPSTSPYANAVNTPLVYIDDSAGNETQATNVYFSGLAPGFAGLYQINFQVPSGVASGPTSLEILAGLNSNGEPDSDTFESELQVGTTSSDATPAARAKARKRALIRQHLRARPTSISANQP